MLDYDFNSANFDSSQVYNSPFHRENNRPAIKKSWDCPQCKKCFKEKKDLEQHLNSGTHDAIRYSCSECGKGFASLGALTLHIEQAGHQSMNEQLLRDVEMMNSTPAYLRNKMTHGINQIMPRYPVPPNDVYNRNYRHDTSHFNPSSQSLSGYLPTDRISIPAMYGRADPRFNPEFQYESSPLPPSSSPLSPLHPHFSNRGMPPFNVMPRVFLLHIASYTERFVLEAGYCYTILDEQSSMLVVRDGQAFNQLYPGSMQPEYEALFDGLSYAHKQQIRCIRLFTSNELIYKHLCTGTGSNYFQSCYHVVTPLFSTIKKLCHEFPILDVVLVSANELSHELRFAKDRFLATRNKEFDSSDNFQDINYSPNTVDKSSVY